MIKTWEDIPGFFDFMDIYDQAVAEAEHGAIFVEVGTFLGKSAAYMAQAIRNSGKIISFTCVDSWDETAYDKWWTQMDADPPRPWPCEELYGKSLYDAFWQAQVAVGNGSQPTIKLPSVRAAAMYPDHLCRFVFIDANHLYEGISADIAAWRNKVKPGCIFAGHDYDVALWPDVKRAVDEAFGDRVEHRGTSWMVRM